MTAPRSPTQGSKKTVSKQSGAGKSEKVSVYVTGRDASPVPSPRKASVSLNPENSAESAVEYVGSHPVSPEAPPKNTFWGYMHRVMLPWVLDYEHHVVAVQRMFGVVYSARPNEEPQITNKLADQLLRLVSELGNEVFLALWATLISTWFDYRLATQMVILWAFALYFGQYLKDSVRLPRPGLRPGSQVARLEKHYQFEFGFPSTHMMLAVSQPVLFIYKLYTQYEMTSVPLFLGLLVFATFWMVGTPLSRLYLGVHSSFDVVTGCILGLFSLFFVTFSSDLVGGELYTPLGALCVVLVSIFLMAIYPRPGRWVNSPGDTAIVVGTTAGVLIGYAFNVSVIIPMFGLPFGPQPQSFSLSTELSQSGLQFVTYQKLALPVSYAHCLIAIARLLLTVVCIYLARKVIFKPICLIVLRALFGKEPPHTTAEETALLKGDKLVRAYQIEVWEKFFGYGTMGFGATAIWTYVWDYIGLVYSLPNIKA